MLQNIGFTEILLIGIVALVLFGPQKLPEIGKMIGKTLNEFKKGARGLLEEVKEEPTGKAPADPVQKLPESASVPAPMELPDQADAALDAPPEVKPEPSSPPRSDPRRLPD
jgi:sec-independent protein translocase protein TatA